MARIGAQELLERLKKGKPIPAILLLGDEPYLRDECRKQLIERFVSQAARDWALSRYSAARGETSSALEQGQTLPMLAPQQVVFLENVEAIEKFGEKNRESAIEALQTYLGNPAPFTVLVLEASNLDQRMKLAKLLADQTLVVECSLGDNPEEKLSTAAVLARRLAKGQGCDFESGAAEDLAEATAGDLLRLKTEIAKLATHAGERRIIRRQDVALMVISEKSATVWELTDLLAARDSRRALDFLHRLLRDGEEPLQILGAMAWMYRKLIEASELKGLTNGFQAARALAMRPDQAELALRAGRKIPRAQLLAGVGALQRADDRLKRGGEDSQTIMEFLIVELTGALTGELTRRHSSAVV